MARRRNALSTGKVHTPRVGRCGGEWEMGAFGGTVKYPLHPKASFLSVQLIFLLSSIFWHRPCAVHACCFFSGQMVQSRFS